jgi:hypothetical protein
MRVNTIRGTRVKRVGTGLQGIGVALFSCSHNDISPLQVPSVNPRVSMQCCHLGPPLSFRLRYCNNFCLLCTSKRRFRLLCLSPFPRACRKSANVLIFAVKMAIWTSDEPVSGPTRFAAAAMFVSGRTVRTSSAPDRLSDGALGGNILSVLWRPNVSTHRMVFARIRSLLDPFSRAVIRAIASAARAWSFSLCSSMSWADCSIACTFLPCISGLHLVV